MRPPDFNAVPLKARASRWLTGLGSLTLTAWLAVQGCLRVEAADPPYYRRGATWFETLEATVAALHRAAPEEGFAPFESPICRGGQPARRIRVDVRGAQAMTLEVVGDPTKVWGVADWAEPVLVDQEGKPHPLTTEGREADGKPAVDWSVQKGRHEINLTLHSGLYEPLRLGGREFPRGIHVQADSAIRVALDGAYDRFEAWIGVDDWAGSQGSVRFRVLGDRATAVEQLWDLLARDFSHASARREMGWERQDRIWTAAWAGLDLGALARRYGEACAAIPELAGEAAARAKEVQDTVGLQAVRRVYQRARALRDAHARAEGLDLEGLRLAIDDLGVTWGAKYPGGDRYRARLAQLERDLPVARQRAQAPAARLSDFETLATVVREVESLRSEALLANPALDFDRLLLIQRRPVGDPRRSQWADRGLGEYLGLPRQSSWGLGTMPVVDDWDNQLVGLSPVRPEGKLQRVFHPGDRRLVTDVDLHWDGQRALVSMPDAARRWQVWEVGLADGALRQLSPAGEPDVHHYDACYLPNDRVVFLSTAPLQGVPCNAGVIVGMLYSMDGDGQNLRQLAFEQDHDYTPSVLNNGRVLYLRWDYTDTPHVWNRLLMSMNPDGTGQMEYYGSNSYWPNAVFFARAIPGHPTQVAGIVTGHHEGRVGELVVFDPARGRREADGVVQRIPGRHQRVRPVIEDKPTEHSWPKFLHPWPLNEKSFLVAAKPSPDALWGIYLADVFDNLVLVHEAEEYALLEPIPWRARPRPPVIPDRVRPSDPQATVYLSDIYRGPGLAGVPRGSVKRLRLFTYHFGYQRLAGIDHRVGADGPWEIKRVLGTVPVEADGSALFRIPAKTPLSLQPLDADGQALALMRSWMTAMPGEAVSCVGCHEPQSSAPANHATLALQGPPAEIVPWYGPPRGFSFSREVQPVLDRYCVGCHDGQPGENGRALPDLRADPGYRVVYTHGQPDLKRVNHRTASDLVGQYAGVFDPAYTVLRAFVRVGGLESDLHPLPAREFHAGTSELVQMLRQGHHGVQLDAEAWDRIVTWIDLNAPCHGTWAEVSRIPIPDQPGRRRELQRRYGGRDEDPEQVVPIPLARVEPVIPPPPAPRTEVVPACEGWPFEAPEAARRQAALGPTTRTLDLGGGVSLELVRIPPGRFVMGDPAGNTDERPQGVEVERPFWIGKYEVTNEQYRRFDPTHDSRFEHRSSWIFDAAYLGWPLNGPRQPVVRVSWESALAFARWLSARTGARITLPTEVQWEYACRAGTSTALSYGTVDTDFSRWGNLADVNLRRLAWEGWRPRSPDLVPRVETVDDDALVTADVGRYAPNAWGLHDLHGNAAEWTRSSYGPSASATPGAPTALGSDRAAEEKVVRGGSWRDRPQRCRSSFRLGYPAHQRIFNVGFRVVLEDADVLARE